MEKDGDAKHILIRLFALSAVGLAAVAAAMHYHHHHRKRKPMGDARTVPRLRINESGRVEELENFGQYVARQLGFVDPKECPTLCKLASDYLKKSKTCEENIYSFCGNVPHLNPDDLYIKLLEEIDKCILGYFAFHWTHATLVITKALGADREPKKKFKSIVMEATRNSRFERITKSLKVARVFSTLVEEMKAIGIANADGLQRCTEVMVPADRSQRSPVLLLMGGGMGAGKSTVLKDILGESFWSGTEPVVVEADAFKETDVIYRALSSHGHHNDMLQTAELVHQSSTDAASSLLVTALNEGRDVIMDGTLSWEPFVEQTIAMARSVHQCRYRMGLGYKVMEDGTTIENYWEPVEDDDDDDDEDRQRDQTLPRKPYRIELVGVMCDAYLAVVRGIRRAIMIGRAVRVKSQLTSHKRFASAFPRYCNLVDNARLYSTNSMGSSPKLIAWKDSSSDLLVDSARFRFLKKLGSLNEQANCIAELYTEAGDCGDFACIFKDVVLSPTRRELQKELHSAVQEMEKSRS